MYLVESSSFEKDRTYTGEGSAIRGKVFSCKKKLMGFEIIGAQAQDTSPNVGIKNGPSTSKRPLMVSLKGRPETRAKFAPLQSWQPKEFVLGENTQSPPIGKVEYFPIIAPQLSLINRFTIRKENLLSSDRNIISSSN